MRAIDNLPAIARLGYPVTLPMLEVDISHIDGGRQFATIIYMKASSLQTHSFRLFSRPTFLEGAARVFDFTNILQRYRYDSTDDEADANALRSDWMAVGDDIRDAIGIYER